MAPSASGSHRLRLHRRLPIRSSLTPPTNVSTAGSAPLDGRSVRIPVNQPFEIFFRRDDATTRLAKIGGYNQRYAAPFVSAENGFIDAVIEPHQTRLKLIRGLRMLENKKDTLPRKKHGNIPL